MEEIGRLISSKVQIPFTDAIVTINPVTMKTTWAIMVFMLVIAILIRLGIKKFPGKSMMTFELMYEGFGTMMREALGSDARKFAPLIFTLFIFVLISNWVGVIPGVESPTSDLNTCLGLGVMIFVICHMSALMHKGFKKYLLSYTQPFLFFLPLNVVGEFGKVISHSFRLFGNIYAGGIILALAGPVTLKIFNALALPAYSASPILLFLYMILQGFFGLFVGTVQALVFALLALTYIAVLREN